MDFLSGIVFQGVDSDCPHQRKLHLASCRRIEADHRASDTIAQYDADNNGTLSKAECKGSGFDFPKWDANSNGNLDKQEIVARLQLYQDNGAGLLEMTCKVLWNNRPLENGIVVFEPEPFLGDSIEAAEGIIDLDGWASPSIPEVVAEDPVLTGVRPGLYKIRITHPDVEIPAKYNEDTILGYDASPIEMLNPPRFSLRK